MPSPPVQRSANFEPTTAEANSRQSPTSYIIPLFPDVGMHSAIIQDQIPATPGYWRGEPLMHEACPLIAIEMPADSFYYQPRSATILQLQK